MRYFTKEWYKSLDEEMVFNEFEMIEDKEYSDEDIKGLYNTKLQAAIEEERELHNTKPEKFDVDDYLEFNEFDPDDFLVVDEETNQSIKLNTVEDLRKQVEGEYLRNLEEFEDRPEFDPAPIEQYYAEKLGTYMETDISYYPEWMLNEVDHRLIVLGYLPEKAFLRYDDEILAREYVDDQEVMDLVIESYESDPERLDVSEEIDQAFNLHDAAIVSYSKDGNNLIMTLKLDGYFLDGDQKFREIVFKDIEVLEEEVEIEPELSMEDGDFFSDFVVLYVEVYKNDKYEIHFLIDDLLKVFNLTVSANAIEVLDDEDFSY